MERGSDRLSVHRDEEMKHELQGLLRSGRSTRTEEWNDPEPTADDDPVIAGGHPCRITAVELPDRVGTGIGRTPSRNTLVIHGG